MLMTRLQLFVKLCVTYFGLAHQ